MHGVCVCVFMCGGGGKGRVKGDQSGVNEGEGRICMSYKFSYLVGSQLVSRPGISLLFFYKKAEGFL